jgi:hypothetical protein
LFACFLDDPEVWIQGFVLEAGALPLEPHIQPFCSGCFGAGVLVFCLDHDPPILCFPLSLGWQVCATMSAFFHRDGVSWTFFLAWPRTMILLLSASFMAWYDRLTHWSSCLLSWGLTSYLPRLTLNLNPPSLNLKVNIYHIFTHILIHNHITFIIKKNTHFPCKLHNEIHK